MNPLIASGLLSLGRSVINGVFSTSSNTSAAANSSDFGTLLNSEDGKIRLKQLQQEMQALKQSLNNLPEVQAFLANAPDAGNTELVCSDEGSYKLVRSDGAELELESGSMSEQLAIQIDHVAQEKEALKKELTLPSTGERRVPLMMAS